MANRLTIWSSGDTLTDTAFEAEWNNIYIGTVDRSAGRWGSLDDIPITFGTSQDVSLAWNTTQTSDALVLGLSGSRHFIICEEADKGTDFQIAGATDPTLIIHSSDATTIADYIALSHNQTNAVINVGAGNLLFNLGGTTQATVSTTGLSLSGTIVTSNTGPHAIGGAALTQAGLSIYGSYTPSGVGNKYNVLIGSTLVVPANDTAMTFAVDGHTITRAGSGTHPLFAGAFFARPVIGAGAATVTEAASVYIENAPTSGATNMYAFHVEDGVSRFDGNIGETGNLVPNILATKITTATIESSAAIALTPASGSGIAISLATTGDFVVNTSHLVVDTSLANVGIGTASPTSGYKLHLYNGASDAYQKIETTGASTNASIYMLNGDRSYSIGTRGDSGDIFAITDETAAAIRQQLSTAGLFRWNAYGAGTLTTDASGNITATSDETLKESITEYDYGLAQLLQINPINYKWKASTGLDTANTYAGWSAQNVKEWIPPAVGKGPNGKYTLNDRPLLMAAVNAIKTLKVEVDELRAALSLQARRYEPLRRINDQGIVKSAGQ